MDTLYSYLICSTERTGSYLYCDALARMGIAGYPKECFHPGYLARLTNQTNTSTFTDFISKVLREGTTPNGVFGAKIHWSHLEDLLDRLSILPKYNQAKFSHVLPEIFPNLRYVHLTRRDKVRQAVSLLKALQTKTWWELKWNEKVIRRDSGKTPIFDFNELDRLLHQVTAHDMAWKNYFNECSIEPLVVTYEDLVESYEAIIRKTLHYLKIPLPNKFVIPRPRYQKQADLLSEKWIQQYQEKQTEFLTAVASKDVPQGQTINPLNSSRLPITAPAQLPALQFTTKPLSPLRLICYSAQYMNELPNLLARCIRAKTPHQVSCLLGYDNDETPSFIRSPEAAEEGLKTADVVIVFNGQVAIQHRRLLEDKGVVVIACDEEKMDPYFVLHGFPSIGLGIARKTKKDFVSWGVAPIPLPLWEEVYQPKLKAEQLTIITAIGELTNSNDQSENHVRIQAILAKLANRYGVQVIDRTEANHNQRCGAQIVLDNFDTGEILLPSLEGLARGSVVINGVGKNASILNNLRAWINPRNGNPFVYTAQETLEGVLTQLIRWGTENLVAEGCKNKAWMEQNWNFSQHWQDYWNPIVNASLQHREERRPKQWLLPSNMSLQERVSVVVVSHNEGEYLERTVNSLLDGLSGKSEIIVVDDGSTDGSTEGLEVRDKRIRILKPEDRLGVARARNYGANEAQGEIIVFSDAHVEVLESWINPLAAILAHPEIGAVAPAISVMGSQRPAKGFGGYVMDSELQWHWLGWQGVEPHPVPLLCGCFLAMRRDVYEATGGFDSGMILYGAEDTEFSMRLWMLGYECWVEPNVNVSHMFRNRDKLLPDYQRSWEPQIHNVLRTAIVHYGNGRLQRLIERKNKNDAFPDAFARLADSDVWERRNKIQAIRRYDDDWFFQNICMNNPTKNTSR